MPPLRNPGREGVTPESCGAAVVQGAAGPAGSRRAGRRVAGAGHGFIIRRHILPNCLNSAIVLATLTLGDAILIAASLSFIGLGAQPPTPEWGAMIASGRKFLMDQWWYATFPGLFILFTLIGFNIFGDALRHVLGPRIRR